MWTIISLPDCPRCAQAKEVLVKLGLKFTEINADDLQKAKVKDRDALAALAMNNMEVPVILDGEGGAHELSELQKSYESSQHTSADDYNAGGTGGKGV